MKKINNIHIGGHAFFFEEDASSIMELYLARIKELYRDNGEELKVADVEQRVAEFCNARVGENGIVNAALIKEAIESIGIKIEPPTAQVCETADTTDKQPTDDTKAQEPKEQSNEPWYQAMLLGKKIYRNPHSGYVGGVLAGLAAYFGISVALLRILAIILFFAEPVLGIVFLTYIALWIIFPKATSIIDHTRMRKVDAKDGVQEAWKKNYEQAMVELAQSPANGCLPTLVKVLFFMPLLAILIPMSILIVAIIVIPLGVISLFCTNMGLLSLPLVVMGISIITTVAIIIFAIGHWILKKAKVCKPMKRTTKRVLIITFIIISTISITAAVYTISSYGGIENIKTVVGKRKELLHDIMNGDFASLLKYSGKYTIKHGEYYNCYPLETESNEAWGVIWNSNELQQCNIPFIVESIHTSDGKYDIYLYEPSGDADTDKATIHTKDYVIHHSIELPEDGEVLNGWLYFIWDSKNSTIYVDETYENSALLNVWSSANTRINNINSRIFIGDKNDIEGLSYSNATEKGYNTFAIFYYGNQRQPSLTAGGSDKYSGLHISEYSSCTTINRQNVSTNTHHHNDVADSVQLNRHIIIDTGAIDSTANRIKNMCDTIMKQSKKIAEGVEDIVKQDIEESKK